MTVLVNKSIPRTMTLEGLEFLGRLAASVPKNGVIVEVGPLFGSSTWVLSKNAHPSVRIISIDTWDPQPWIDKIEAKFPGCKPFSKDAFLHYTRDCPNVTAVQGWSPQVMSNWNQPIDMFFDDATHGDPGFTESLEFYVPKVTSGGIVCGDDFASGWPDIIAGVTRLGSSWGAAPEVIGRVWTLVKPDGKAKAPALWDRLEKEPGPNLTVKATMRDGRVLTSDYGVWAGALHQPLFIEKIGIDLQAAGAGIDGVFQLVDVTGGVSPWTKFGQTATVSAPMAGIRMHLFGPDAGNYSISYQICTFDPESARKKTANTSLALDGKLLRGVSRRQAACALRCVIHNRPPRLPEIV